MLDNLGALPGTHADRIEVLEGGRIVEEGRHEGRLALRGTDAGLRLRQACEHQSDAQELRSHREHR